MILADKFTCDVPLEGNNFIECVTPAPGLLEWMTAIGTVGATLVAVTFGIVELARSRMEQNRRRLDNERQVLNVQFQKLIGMVADINDRFPLVEWSENGNYYTQLRIYKNLLTANSETPEEIKNLAADLFTKVGHLSFMYNVHASEKMKSMVESSQPWKKGFHTPPGVVLEMLWARLESALSAWHATGLGEEAVIEDLKDLKETVDSSDEYLREFENKKES